MRMTAVVGTRNDGYGGHYPDRRFIFSIESLIHYFDEVVVVDWNSSGETMMDKNRNFISKTGKIKEVVVTREDLENVSLSVGDIFPESYVKNIGLRRSSNDWVALTNPDICLIDWFSINRDLSLNKLYVSPRKNTWTYVLYEKFQPREFMSHLLFNHNSFEEEQSANFQFAHKHLWNKIRGLEESNFIDTDCTLKADFYAQGTELVDHFPVIHLSHNTNSNFFIPQSGMTNNTENWGLPFYDFNTRFW